MSNVNISWEEESKRFDEAADYYDRFRPSYPKELIDCIVDKTGINSNSVILEIGAGSGKATELFVDRGLNLCCIEPGENLALAGQRKFDDTGRVKYIISRFENWQEVPESFDLAISAQAFHWVPKPVGFEKCAKALKRGKYMALFWNMYLLSDEPVEEDIESFSREFGNLCLCPVSTEEDIEDRIKSNIEEIAVSGYFKTPEIYRFSWSKSYTAEEYMGFLKTGNGYLALNERDRGIVEEKIIEIINKHGGIITRPYECILYLSQRL